jgi:DDE superfamily endonuclease
VARLSLEPSHRRGWGSAYDALANGRINVDWLRDLLVRVRPPADPLVFAVDVTTWPRCDAECSPERGYYYHPSRHSAGQPIIAGWAFQWIAQLGFERDSWTAPVDARRLHPLEDTDQAAAAQIRALLGRLGANGRVPLFVFDGGYDSAPITLDLAEERVAVLVRLRSDRCFYADPPPAARSPRGGRPRRHGAKFAFADPATWPAPTASLVCQDDQYGSVTVQAWAGLHPKQQRHPGHGSRGPRPIVRGTILGVQSSASRPAPARRRCWGCGGPGPAHWTWTFAGGRTSAGSTWSTPSGLPNRLSAGPSRALARPSRPTAGPGWCWPPPPSSAWPARSPATSGCRGSGPDPSRGCHRCECGAGFRGCCALWARQRVRRNPSALPRPAQGPLLGTRDALPGDQEARHQAQEEAAHDRQDRLISPPALQAH